MAEKDGRLKKLFKKNTLSGFWNYSLNNSDQVTTD